eukprot:g2980.t1
MRHSDGNIRSSTVWIEGVDPTCKDNREPTGSPCVFPFNYKGVNYDSCTEVESAGAPWCGTEGWPITTGYTTGNNNWGYCGSYCNVVDACDVSVAGTFDVAADDPCLVECAEGYVGSLGYYSCATDDSALLLTQTGGETCTPVVTCASLDLGTDTTGVVPKPTSTQPCTLTNGIVQGLDSGATCDLSCDSGYVGADASIYCTATNNGDPMNWVGGGSSISCEPIRCASIESAPWWDAETFVLVGGHATSTRLAVGDAAVIVQCGNGYTGSVTASVTCPSDASDMQHPVIDVVPQCLEISCAPFSFGTGTAERTVGMIAEGVLPCGERQVLSTVTVPMCTVGCKPGYVMGDPTQSGNVTCPRASATQNSDPVVDLTCEEITCTPLAMNETKGVVGGGRQEPSFDSEQVTSCFDGVELKAVTNKYCSVTCKQGFSRRNNSHGSPHDNEISYYKCRTNSAVGLDPKACDDNAETGGCKGYPEEFACVEHTCAPFDINDFDPNFVETGSEGLGCTPGLVLSTNTQSECTLRCKNGGTNAQSISVRCPPNAAQDDPLVVDSFQCTGIQCPPISFTDGVIGDPSSGKRCALNAEMYETDYCTVACESGYSATNGNAPHRIMCVNINGTYAGLETSFSCTENSCAPFSFPPGVVGSETAASACYENIVLSTQTLVSCEVECAKGFERAAGSSSVVTCPSNAAPGASAESSISCTEIECAPLDFPIGVGSVTCVEGGRLSADPTSESHACTVQCLDGFTTVFSQDGGVTTLTCPEDAEDGDVVDGFDKIACVENHCAPLEFPVGAVPAFRAIDGSTDSSLGCDRGEELSTQRRSACGLECGPGYVESVSNASLAACKAFDTQVVCSSAGARCVWDEESQRCASAVRCASNATVEESVSMDLTCVLALTRIEMRCATPGCTRWGEGDSDAGEGGGGGGRRRSLSVSAFAGRALADADKRSSTSTLASSCSSDDGHDVASLVTASSSITVSTEGGDVVDFEGFDGNVTCDPSDSTEQRSELFLLSGAFGVEDSADVPTTASPSSGTCDLLSSLTSSVGDRTLRCKIPSGLGQHQALRLFRGRGLCARALAEDSGNSADDIDVTFENTNILDDCFMSYADPIISDAEGCMRGDKCSRDGGNVVTVNGYNFGKSDALIFVNGQECFNATHGDATSTDDCASSSTSSSTTPCHRTMTCTIPPLTSWQTSGGNQVLLVQSQLFVASTDAVHYDECNTGHRQVEASNACEECEPGRYSDVLDAYECAACPVGTASGAFGVSVCEPCDQGSVADGEGFTKCTQCPGGKKADVGGSNCVDCDIWYLGEGAGSNCETPVFGILLAVFGNIFVALFAIVVWRRYFALQKTIDYQKTLVSSRDDEIRLMTDAWRISWEQIEIEKELARGGGGIVYKGKMSGTEVAVKTIFETIKVDLASQQEVRWMQRARHPRLVLFFGCGRAPDNNIFVCIEFMANGDLLRLLETSRADGRPLPWHERFQYLVDVAEACEYVHLNLGSIHRDLKSENVLLSVENGILRAKVADFGLSRIVGGGAGKKGTKRERSSRSGRLSCHIRGGGSIGENQGSLNVLDVDTTTSASRSDILLAHQSNMMTSGKGTVAYMAPELLTKEVMRSKNAPYSQAVDTFAFGVIMWEVCELKRAWGDEKWSANIIKTVIGGQRLPLSSSYILPYTSPPVGYVELMRVCWTQHPKDRPTFDRILDGLLAIIDSSGLNPVTQQRQSMVASSSSSASSSSPPPRRMPDVESAAVRAKSLLPKPPTPLSATADQWRLRHTGHEVKIRDRPPRAPKNKLSLSDVLRRSHHAIELEASGSEEDCAKREVSSKRDDDLFGSNGDGGWMDRL